MRPLDELHLGHELRLHPDDVALPHAWHLRNLPERRRVAPERLQLLQEPVDLAVVEPGADVAGVDEISTLVGREHERAERSLTTALAARVAGDHELLPAVALDLQPLARPPAGQVAGAEPLGHDPFEALLLRGCQERLSVLEGLREAHCLVPLVQKLLQSLAPLLEREVDDRLALHLEQVEDEVDDRRAGLALLHRREARPALVVQGADLAVDDAVRGLEGLDELLRHVLEALRVVLILSRAQLGLAAGDGRDDPVPVPFDLVDPAVSPGHLVGERGQHRRVPARLPRDRRRLVLLPEDEPVLLVAGKVGGHERVGAVQPLAVQADGEAAVLLLLDELVRALVPDLDGAGAVLALRDLALERAVLERMVLDVHGEVLLSGLERDALRNRPAGERSVPFEAKVVVQAPRVMPLDDEDRVLAALLRRRTAPASSSGRACFLYSASFAFATPLACLEAAWNESAAPMFQDCPAGHI